METEKWLGKWFDYNSIEEDDCKVQTPYKIKHGVPIFEKDSMWVGLRNFPTILLRSIVFFKIDVINRWDNYWRSRILTNYKYYFDTDTYYYRDKKSKEVIYTDDMYDEARTFKFKLDYVIRYSWR